MNNKFSNINYAALAATANKNFRNKTKKQKNLNNSFNILNTNLEGLQKININTPEWNISPGNRIQERIPLSLQYKPNVPKMMLPAFLQTKGGRRTRRRRSTKHSTRRMKRKN